MPVISTFAALSAKGYGFGAGSPLFGGGGWLSRNSATGAAGTSGDMVIDSSGNIYTLYAVSTTSTALVKTNYQGTVVFYKTISLSLITITLDSSGNIYLGGSTYQGTGISSNGYACIVKLDSSGALTWARSMNAWGLGYYILNISIDGSGNVYGFTTNNGYAILSSSGAGSSFASFVSSNIIKGYRDNSTGNYWTMPGSVSITNRPPYLGLGTSINCRNSSNTTIFSYAPTFSGFSFIHDFIIDSSGNAYLACNNSSTGTLIVSIIKLNSSGVQQWSVYKGFSHSSGLAESIPTLRLTLNSDASTIFLSYGAVPPSGNAAFTDAIKTSDGSQLWSNYKQIDSTASTSIVGKYSNYNNQLVLNGGRSIWNVPGNIPKVPSPGTYTLSGFNYVYYPYLSSTYQAFSTSSTTPSTSISTTSLTVTTITPTIANATDTITTVSIGTGI